jgi:hypothetical protein
LKWSKGLSLKTCALLAVGVIVLQALVLLALGQPPICACGYVKLWHGLASSPETSQHLSDWYTPSHVIHGVGFYFILWLIAPGMPIGCRFALALGLEAGWEVLENTPFIIDRYRQTALAQGYFGDSIVNSVADTLAAALGFVLARIMPVWATLAFVVGTELFTAYMIRDNLTLNPSNSFTPAKPFRNGRVEAEGTLTRTKRRPLKRLVPETEPGSNKDDPEQPNKAQGPQPSPEGLPSAALITADASQSDTDRQIKS